MRDSTLNHKCRTSSLSILMLDHDAHPSELPNSHARPREAEKQNARRVAWVEHRSTTFNFDREIDW
jgi:hypothetical protein